MAADLATYGVIALVLLIFAFIFAFAMGFGMGANDLSNSFSAVYGAGSLSSRNIIIVAAIFELSGAILIGMKVSETLRGGIISQTDILNAYTNSTTCIAPIYMENPSEIINQSTTDALGCPEMISLIGSAATLFGCSTWMLLATFMKLPVSSSHSAVGGVTGYALVALHGKSVKWSKFGLIVVSWFLSPVSSGLLSVVIFKILEYTICKKRNSFEAALCLMPYIYFIMFFTITFSTVYQGSELLYFNRIPLYGVFILSISVSLTAFLIGRFIVIPYIRKRHFSIPSTCVSANAVNNLDLTSHEIRVSINDSHRHFPENTDENAVVIKNGLDLDKFSPSSCENTDTSIKDDERTLGLFRYLQIISSCYMAFSHGGNDVGNAVSQLVNAWLIYDTKKIVNVANTPPWILIFGGMSLVFGLALWGKPLLERLGKDIVKLNPITGFSVELGTVVTVLSMSKLGLPISTTHCITGGMVALGIAKSGIKSLKPKLLVNIALSWFVTVPVSGLITALVFFVTHAFIFRT